MNRALRELKGHMRYAEKEGKSNDMNLMYHINKAKDVKFRDYCSIIPMILGLISIPLYKKKYKEAWAISERKTEACDNGFHFFAYVSRNHPEQKCIYAIDKKCKDYEKVKNLGETVQYGSIKHWALYFLCKYLISSQAFKPNGYICTFIERLGVFRPDHIFLQHGITKDMAEFLLASHRRAKKFIAGAYPEYRFMDENFGYPHGTIIYTGFARFDNLHNYQTISNRILIMPTWRKWLKYKSEAHEDANTGLESSEYILAWKDLLFCPEFSKIIRDHQLEVVFFMHPNMQGSINLDMFKSNLIRIVKPGEEDIQELLKSSKLLITDYSSVFFDMVYMKKPVIFYQFDEEKYRKYHYQKGWFDYHCTAFGKSCSSKEEICKELIDIIAKKFRVSQEYIAEHERTFTLHDERNCERIFKAISYNE